MLPFDIDTNNENIHEGQISFTHGFVPNHVMPLALPDKFQAWDTIAKELPDLIKTGDLRREIKKLPILSANNPTDLPNEFLVRASIILGNLAQAYYFFSPQCHSQQDDPLCDSIKIPWEQICKRLNRSFIDPRNALQAARTNFDTFMCNWTWEESVPISERNLSTATPHDLKLLVPVFENNEERCFNLTITLMESRFAPALKACIDLLVALEEQQDDQLMQVLSTLAKTVENVTEALDFINLNQHSPFYVDPVIWTKTVARFDGQIPGGSSGVTGGLSPLFHVLDILIERKNYDSFLGRKILENRKWLPEKIKKFLFHLEESLQRKSLYHYVSHSSNPLLKQTYQFFIDTYLAPSGLKDVHDRKVFGYMKCNYRAGRLQTNGGHFGTSTIETEPAYTINHDFKKADAERVQTKKSWAIIGRKIAQHNTSTTSVISLDFSGSGVHFNAGDRVSIYPQNDLNTVSQFIQKHQLDAEQSIKLTPSILQQLAHRMTLDDVVMPLKALLKHIILTSSMVIAGNVDLEKLQFLASRLYSISPTFGALGLNTYSLTFRHQFPQDNSFCTGIGSSFLKQLPIHGSIPLKKSTARFFHLPIDPNDPVIMFAAGTGLSPFIGFINQLTQQDQCNNWLFLSFHDSGELSQIDELQSLSLLKKTNLIILYTREKKIWKCCSNNDFVPQILVLDEHKHIDYLIQLQKEKLSALVEDRRAHFYICGSHGFAQTVLKNLERECGLTDTTKRIASNRLHLDIFSSPGLFLTGSITYSRMEVAKHNNPQDGYWTIIGNQIYDLSHFINLHPGGKKILQICAGNDATADFNLIGHDRQQQVSAQLQQYQIGYLTQHPALSTALLSQHYELWNQFLDAVVEMQNSFINNTDFNHDVPRYIWFDVFSIFLGGGSYKVPSSGCPFNHQQQIKVPKDQGTFKYVFGHLFSTMTKILCGTESNINADLFNNAKNQVIFLAGRVQATIDPHTLRILKARYQYMCQLTGDFLNKIKFAVIRSLTEIEEIQTRDPQASNTVFLKWDQEIAVISDAITEYLRTIVSLTSQGEIQMKEKVCVVVDGFSTGRHLVDQINKYGYKTVHVQSRATEQLPHFFTKNLDLSKYHDCIVYQGNAEETVQLLSEKYIVECVIAGSESAVVVADLISEKLELKSSNGTALSQARRDKAKMVEALAANGVKHVEQLRSSSAEEILHWISQQGLEYPVVVKPVDSAGTDGFSLCHNEQDVIAAVGQLLLARNFLNEPNYAVLVQRYLDGQEYCVNTISLDGKCLVTDILRVDKIFVDPKHKMYDRTSYLSTDDPNFSLLKAYTESVLKAVGIRNGAGHAEIIIEKQSGQPVLVEVAARLMGAFNPQLTKMLYGDNSIEILVESYLQPDAFSARVARGSVMPARQACMIDMLSSETGVFHALNEDKIKSLPSYYGHSLYLRPGDSIVPTIDLDSSPGVLFLCSEDPNQLLRDHKQFRSWENDHQLYRLRANSADLVEAQRNLGFLANTQRTSQTSSSVAQLFQAPTQ